MSIQALSVAVTQKQFGELVGITQPAVSDLMARGIIRDGQAGAEWLTQYCAHLREIAAGRAATGTLNLATERARLAKEQADRVAMENAQTRRELAPIVTISLVLAKAGQQIVAVLDALPGMIKRRSNNLTAEDIDAIQGEIAKCRNIAAAIKLDLNELNRSGEEEDDAK